MINDTIIIEYNKLLDIGIQQIKGTAPNDLEEHAERDKLLPLNDYVYTHYSTNALDDTYSIEFVVLADYMNIILDELKKKGMWYCAKNYKTGEYIKEYDNKINNITRKIYINIHKEDLGRYKPKTEQNPGGWEIIEMYDKENVVKISRDQKIHFLESDTIKEFDDMYNDGNYFLNMCVIDKMKGIIDIDLLSKNVAIIVVEDPEINRNTLYDELLRIFQEKIHFKRIAQHTKKGGKRKRSRKMNKIGKQKVKKHKKTAKKK